MKRSRPLEVSETSISDHPSPSAVVANDDLLTQIHLRLPIRPLLRFKCVSKHWLSLITNPSFSLLFHSNNPNPNPNLPSGLLLHRSSCLRNPELDFVPLNDDHNASKSKPPFRRLNFVKDPCGIKISQSCNGLLFCCSYQSTVNRRKYYVYNPTTNHFTTLPQLRGVAASTSRLIYGVCLAFDPSKSPTSYKVVCVRRSELGGPPHEHLQIEIYSSQTGSWRVSGKPFTSNVITQFEKGVYWNGSIHWLSFSEHSWYFNVDQELLEKMPMPMPQGGEDRLDCEFPYFRESGDHLHLVEITGFNMTRFTVYEMERDYSKWSVKYIVDLNALPMAFPEVIQSNFDPAAFYYYAIAVLLVVIGQKDEDSFLVLHIPGKAIRYNFEDKSFKKIYDFDPGDPEHGDSLRFSGCSNAFPYIESLACV